MKLAFAFFPLVCSGCKIEPKTFGPPITSTGRSRVAILAPLLGQTVQSWFHLTRESCFSQYDCPLGSFFANSKRAFMRLSRSDDNPVMVVLLGVSPISSQRISGAQPEFLFTPLTKALLPRLLSLAGQPTLGRVLVVPNFIHLKIMGATVLLGTFKQQNLFFLLSVELSEFKQF